MASVFVVPMPYYLLFIVGWVPLACTVAWCVYSALLIHKVGFALFGLLVLAVHVAVDGTILGLASMLITTLLFRLLPARVATVVVVLFIAAGLVASSFPIYSLANTTQT